MTENEISENKENNVLDNIIPSGNNYKLESEKVLVQENIDDFNIKHTDNIWDETHDNNNFGFCSICSGKLNYYKKCTKCGKQYMNESHKLTIIIFILLFIIIGLSIYINILIRDISNANKIKNGLIQDYLELESSIPDKSLYDAIMDDSIDEFYLTIKKQSLYNAIIDNKVDEYYLNK